MTDVYSGHSQFVLLTENRRRWVDGRTVFLLVVVTVPIIIFCGIYTIILKSNEALIYPKSHIQVPSILNHRAKIYSKQIKTSENNEIHLNNYKIEIHDDFKLVCYYNFPGNSQALQPSDLDPYLCTHINVGFADIINNTIDLNNQQLSVLQAVVNLKKINENLKILLSVGGAGNDAFSQMVVNHTNRKFFIKSILNLVKLYHIDGVDLDWEFPNQNSHDLHQKVHFTQLLQEIRTTINKQSRRKFLLSCAVAAPTVIIDNSYLVSYLNENVDFINVMTYDFHFYTRITPFTGLNAPLYESSEEKGYFTTLNINYSVHYWISKGMDREKINVGLPTYGHSFRLTNPLNRGLYAPARGYGKLGSLGFVDYTQVCQFLTLNRILPTFDLKAKSPYATKGAEWVSFDNEQSLSFKAEFVRDHQFGGVMVYSLNSDDYEATCRLDPKVQSERFPLVKKIREILDKNYSIF